MTTKTPRVLMPSYRRTHPHVSWASAYEFEDVVCEVDDVELMPYEHEPLTSTATGEAIRSRVRSRIRRWTGFDFERKPRLRKLRVEGQYDLFFTRFMTPQELVALDSIEGWQDSCRVKVCWVEELWPDWLQHRQWVQPLSQFDHVFVGLAPTPESLEKLIDTPCTFLSPAVDSLRYCPHPNPPDRTIDYYTMGRRSPTTHQSMLEYARNHTGFYYLYDSARPTTFVEGHAEHRELSASLIQRSRYFMADRAKANEPDQVGDGQAFGPRFFEGAAAGTVLIGEPPRCETFDAYFDWPDAVIPLPFGSADIGRIIDTLEADRGRVEQARRANMLNALKRHDWLHRWEQVLSVLGLEPRPGVGRRRASLDERVALVEQGR